ncbi:hypothetical protein F5984_19785 [Rudanella paleaurantiibacter]|uniref:Phage terminase large subunit N-terminal domain-containing protein n=1 Tax=Rudanella paleaurantiibacter TaxID=2614655 RepID=A0A7J5TV16_9BACT|nr:hypothetical protein [Rudanella paleaurantiibacter]KAB7727998.1 hypothetical protein F5984_19785 [Rudanella paleaurantiibacter]
MKSSNSEDELELLVNEKQGIFLEAVTSQHFKMVGMVGGRGSGKSITLADFLKIASEELPRAKCGFGVKTIKKAKSKLTSGLKAGWRRWQCNEYNWTTCQGDYVLWREPPDHFDRPYEAPDNWENCITFPNGFCIEFESFKLASDENRGSNYDLYVVDEGLNFKKAWLKIVLPTLRANVGKFDSALHHTFAVFSSPPWTPDGQWMYEIEELSRKDPKNYFYMEVRTRDNQAFLPLDYIDGLKKVLTKMEFEVEVDGKRISKLPKTFYPAWSRELHVLEDHDDDEILQLYGEPFYNPNHYLVASCDFNAHFTSATMFQEDDTWARLVDNVYVKEAEKGDTMAESLGFAIVDRFSGHRKKRIILTGDRNGKNKSAGSDKSMYEQVADVLEKEGWDVVTAPLNFNPPHKDKHLDINRVLGEKDEGMFKLRVDGVKAKATVISIENSPIETNYEKDKGSEKEDVDQERATHLSDTVDYYIIRRLRTGMARANDDFEIDWGE